MGIFSTVMAKKTEKRSAQNIIPDFLLRGGATATSGAHVSADTALGLSTLWSIIQRLSTTIGIFPLRILRNTTSGKEEKNDHYAYRLLNVEPNEYQTAFEFRQIMFSNQLLFGAGIAKIEYDGKGIPTALHIIHPERVMPINNGGKLTYRVQNDVGGVEVYQHHQLLIFKLFPNADGTWKNPISILRETLGDCLAVRAFGSLYFQQGISPSGIVSGIREDLSEESQETLVERFKAYTGLGRTSSMMLLYGNEQFNKVSVTPEESQFLETKRFCIDEICRIYNVPSHLVFQTTANTSWGSGLAELGQSFLDYVMLPHLRRWEQEINKKIVSVDDPNVYAKFVVEGILRGDPKARMESYRQGAQIGLYTVDDLLKMEDRNPIGGVEGNARLVPANMQPLSKAVNYKQEDKK